MAQASSTVRSGLARAAGAVSTWALKRVFRRPAANFPGKIGLIIDPSLIAELNPRLREGSVVVVGTNGKTTTTNLIADAFEAAGKSVACNRTGANLDSGVATTLLHTKGADWGIFESDELWLTRILPQLKPDYVVLLNLFRDQLDRVGEIDRTQAAILEALASSSETTLVYNADDPLCQAIATRAENPCIPFGVNEDLGLTQNTVADSGMCQMCDAMLEYDWRQYGQIGSYQCPSCGFKRAEPVYSASGIELSAGRANYELCHGENREHVSVPFPGTYMLYNTLAVFSLANCCGLPFTCVDEAIQSFDPHNGRLQTYEIDGRHILLNLAKNPTGFNQNLRIVTSEPGRKAVAFFINDREADGHDVSWLWDIDYQELAGVEDLVVYAGGIRRNDMQVRLKYAGIDAELVDGAEDFLAKASAALADARFYLLANYTALPEVKSELDALDGFPAPRDSGLGHSEALHSEQAPDREASPTCEKLAIFHLYPELLNLYGDGGNVIVLADRARRRGLEVEVIHVGYDDPIDLTSADIVFLGGGPDREQLKASHALTAHADIIHDYVEDDGVLLAICGGYQILGREWVLGDDIVDGLGILDITTGRSPGGSRNRLIDNIALKSPLADMPVVGYENHAGRTYLGEGVEPFGTVVSRHGKGNNDDDAADGAIYRNTVGSYLHGPLLAKNPEVADWLIERALERRASKEGRTAPELAPLDDSVERAANEYMAHRLGARI